MTETTSRATADALAPEAFLSYSWDDEDHIAWVTSLAEQLRGQGIDVVLDRFDTSLGSDMALFMEKSGDENSRVLAVVSDQYRIKSDDPAGGVGYERRIIAASVMADLNSDRIVPVLRNNTERKLPRYMGAAKYIDFTDNSKFEERFMELVHELHGRPVLPKPPLGPSPFASGATEAQARAAVRHRAERYISRELTGRAEYDHSNNNGRFTIGADDHEFTVAVSEAGPTVVYVYNDAPNVSTVALAPGVTEFSEVGDGTDYDSSSRVRTVRVGDAAVLQNMNGYWAALLVDEVQTRESSESGAPLLRFRYIILPSKSADFSRVE